MMSMNLAYSKEIPLLNYLLKAFVAAYKVTYGKAPSPMKELRLIMALFLFLFAIIFKTQLVTTAIDTQLMLIISTIYSQERSWKFFRVDVPTLFTKIAISSYFNSYSINVEAYKLADYLKLNVIAFNFDWGFVLNFQRFSIVFCSFSVFLEISTMLKPILAKTSQKPSPMPSVAPVTTTQLSLSLSQYLYIICHIGKNCLTRVDKISTVNLHKGTPNNIVAIIQGLVQKGVDQRLSYVSISY